MTNKRPNILFILTDDQGPWALGLSGNREAYTPNLDRLFREGAYFTNSFVTTPVCSPARVSFLASRYGTEVGITDWINPGTGGPLKDESDLGLDPTTVTWPGLLARAGYATALIGKWHLGTADRFHPTRLGYQYFAGFRGGGTAVENPELEMAGKATKCQGQTADLLTDYAIQYLQEHRSGPPFALCLHHRSPHHPWLPVADEDWAPYKNLDPQIPNPDFPNLDIERVKQATREYLASTTGVDRNVGRLLAVLDELGLAENTVVIFTSDNGYNIGHNGIWHKGNGHWITRDTKGVSGIDPRIQRPNMYDNSIRVPTGLRWPGVVRPGTRLEHTVVCLDWFPTLLAIAGVDLPENCTIHGRNFLPLLQGKSIPWDDDLYCEFSQHHYIEADLRMYRTPEWKLVRDFKRDGHDELYHLRLDPAETKNLINDPQARGIKEELNKKLIAKITELGDPVLK